MDIEFKLRGMDALKAKLAIVTEDMKYKGGRFALRKAANLIAEQARANALRLDDPETGRQIAHNVAVRWNGRLFKSTGDLGFRIGVLGGAESQRTNPDLGLGGKTFHFRWLELGRERQRATPFLRPALESQMYAAADEFVVQYGAALDRALARSKK